MCECGGGVGAVIVAVLIVIVQLEAVWPVEACAERAKMCHAPVTQQSEGRQAQRLTALTHCCDTGMWTHMHNQP